jgi:hypothetical protein
VSIEQVRELAVELFTPSALSVAGVGPDEERFREAIEPLGTSTEAHAGVGGAAR